MNTSTLVVRTEEWPHGLSCMDCDVMLNEGDPYSERLTEIVDGIPLVEITCVTCALG